MIRIKIRTYLMSKKEYSTKYKVSRPKVDKMIESGELAVEEISGTHYIKVKQAFLLSKNLHIVILQ